MTSFDFAGTRHTERYRHTLRKKSYTLNKKIIFSNNLFKFKRRKAIREFSGLKVKAPATMPDDLSVIPETHVVEKN